MSLIRIIKRFGWPRLSYTESTIDVDDGRLYQYRGNDDLSFVLKGEDKYLLCGRPSGQKAISLVGPEGTVGVIRRGLVVDALYICGTKYRVPWVLHPSLPQLGLRFSRLGLFGIGTLWVEVNDPAYELLAMGLLCYHDVVFYFIRG
jgi:hypothetical protein